jgi:hypothetical protein
MGPRLTSPKGNQESSPLPGNCGLRSRGDFNLHGQFHAAGRFDNQIEYALGRITDYFDGDRCV